MSIFPRLSIDGRGFSLTRNGDQERVPFVRVDRFQASGSLLHLLRRSIGLVEIEGFEFDVARGRKPEGPEGPEGPEIRGLKDARDLTIDEIRATHGLLRILPNNPEKLPLRFRSRERGVP